MRILKLTQPFVLTFLLALTAGLFLPLYGREETDAAERRMPELEIDSSRVESTGPQVTSYADVLEDVTPAIVGVYPSRLVTVDPRQRVNPLEEMLRRYYGIPSPEPNVEPQEERMPFGLGSGVVVSPDGYILTNHHVVTDQRGNEADEIRVRLSDEREYLAELIGSDPRTDVAVLKVDPDEGTTFPYLTLADSEILRVGDVVFAVGNPLGVGLTVTMGIVSATDRSNLNILGRQAGVQGYENFIQTDASINPGNSGGALVDAEGRMVGINTAIISRTGGNIGIGFAIPVNLARSIMESLIETGTVRRGFLGVRIDDLSDELADAFGMGEERGALIVEVQDGMPAAAAGLERGDIVVTVGGEPISDANGLRFAVARNRPGEVIAVEYIRDGERFQADVTLGDLDDPLAVSSAGVGEVLEGVQLAAMTNSLRAQYDVQDNINGIVVTEVEGSSPYMRTLREGMVLVEVNDEAVRTLTDLREVLRDGMNKLWVYDRGRFGYVALRRR